MLGVLIVFAMDSYFRRIDGMEPDVFGLEGPDTVFSSAPGGRASEAERIWPDPFQFKQQR